MFNSKNKTRSKLYAEIELHYVSPPLKTLRQANGTNAVVDVIRDFYNPRRINLKEFYWAVFLSKTNAVLGIAEVTVGRQHSVQVNTKEIFQLALKTNASRLVIAHNHSSNDAIKPSESDVEHSKELKYVADILDIELMDSIILSSHGHFSLAANNLL